MCLADEVYVVRCLRDVSNLAAVGCQCPIDIASPVLGEKRRERSKGMTKQFRVMAEKCMIQGLRNFRP